MTAVLKITDGTTDIDLLSLPGFLLEAWRPSIPQYKGGGTFQSSPLSSGRQLVNKQFDNYIESFAFKAQDESQDSLIFEMQEIRRLLEKASDYWTSDWQDDPVWLEARASCETNTRYALIMTGYIPEDENPYAQPFGMVGTADSVMDDMTLIVEHTGWTENQPGTSTAVAIDGTQDYDGLTYGRASTTAKEVYISNHQNTANLTHIFVSDGGVFGPNLLGIGVPYALLPAVPAVNDAVYFGIDVAPFTSLVFDIQTAQTDVTGIEWQYMDVIGGWTALSVMDNTNDDGAMTGVAFDTTGVKSVHFEGLNEWVVDAVNGVNAFWIRAIVTAIGAAPTAPIQQNRDVYAVVRASVTIDNLQVGGDIPALANVKIFDVSDRDGSGGNIPNLYQTRAILGLRSVARGADFTPYLYLSNSQNPVGVTVTYPGAIYTEGVIHAPGISASGLYATASGIFVLSDSATVTLNPALMAQYYGKYRVFVRMRIDVNAGATVTFTTRLKATVGSGSEPTYSELFSTTQTGVPTLRLYVILDLGTIEIGSGLTGTELGDSTALTLQTSINNANGRLYLADFILMPVDEFAADVATTSTDTDSYLQRGTYLEIDSIKNPSLNLRTLLFNTADQVRCRYRTISNGLCTLQANTDQKLWFLFMRPGSGTLWTADFESSYIVQVNRQNQYLSMRGDR